MVNKKTYFILFVLLGLIALIQIYSNGKPIFVNVFHYQYIKAVRPMQWINFIIGLLSLIVLLIVKIKYPSRKKIYAVVATIVINILFIILHFNSFFSSKLF
jgi:cell division protein FtsW (lipid II flippase)